MDSSLKSREGGYFRIKTILVVGGVQPSGVLEHFNVRAVAAAEVLISSRVLASTLLST